MLAGELGVSASRSVDIMADAAHWILTQRSGECSGNTFIDDEVLTQRAGMSEADLDKYRVSRLVPLMPDFYVGEAKAPFWSKYRFRSALSNYYNVPNYQHIPNNAVTNLIISQGPAY